MFVTLTCEGLDLIINTDYITNISEGVNDDGSHFYEVFFNNHNTIDLNETEGLKLIGVLEGLKYL